MGDVIMKTGARDIISGVIGLLVLIYVLQAVLPQLFALEFTNASIWGSFGAAILPVIFSLLIAAGALYLVINGIMATFGMGKGKGGYGL